MAPEVLEGKPYSYSVDYWSLGCILYEFVAGFPPFTGENPEETWTRLCNWRESLHEDGGGRHGQARNLQICPDPGAIGNGVTDALLTCYGVTCAGT